MNRTKGYLLFILAFTAIANCIVRDSPIPIYILPKHSFSEICGFHTVPPDKTNNGTVVDDTEASYVFRGQVYLYSRQYISYQAFALAYIHAIHDVKCTDNHKRISESSVWIVEGRRGHQVSSSGEPVVRVNERAMNLIGPGVDPKVEYAWITRARSEVEWRQWCRGRGP
jgi:hypothetical protein